MDLKLVPLYEKFISELPESVIYSEPVFKFLRKINNATLTRDCLKYIIFYMQVPARISSVLLSTIYFKH